MPKTGLMRKLIASILQYILQYNGQALYVRENVSNVRQTEISVIATTCRDDNYATTINT